MTEETHDHELFMFILDVLRHDEIEPMSSILKMLNDSGCIGWREFWNQDFTRAEVEPAIRSLARDGKVLLLQESSDTYDLVEVDPSGVDFDQDERITWVRLTQSGLDLWDKWDPPRSPQDEAD